MKPGHFEDSGVSLDVGGVLLEPDLEALSHEISRQMGHVVCSSLSSLRRAIYLADPGMDPAGGAGAQASFVRKLLHLYTGHDRFSQQVLDAVGRAYEYNQWLASPFCERAHVLSLLAVVPVVLTTNGRGDTASRVSAGGFADILEHRNFRGICDSADVGVGKPDRRIFEVARTMLGTENVVHIGDSLTSDVQGAARAGFSVMHYDPVAVCSRADHGHIRSLAELTM